MKAIKMIGLAVLTALMAMAFVGASSAMAESTTLCTADESPCAEGNVVTHTHEASVGKAKLLTTLGTIECNVLFLGDAAGAMEKGAALGIIGNFTYTNCTLGGSCTATEENGPAEIEVLKESHETAKVTGEYLVHFVCGKSLNCSYNGTGLVGVAKGPLLSTQTNGEVTISEGALTKEAGFLCPKTAKLDITMTPLSKVYVSTPGFDYCVKYEHANTGFYLIKNNGECDAEDATRLGKFEEIETSRAFAFEDMVCIRRNVNIGLYRNYNTNSNLRECTNDLDDGNVGRYELGWIQ